jgi:hypothetical protein
MSVASLRLPVIISILLPIASVMRGQNISKSIGSFATTLYTEGYMLRQLCRSTVIIRQKTSGACYA